MGASVLGPTILSLVTLLNADIKSISHTFTGLAVGKLVGSFLAGIIYDRMNEQLFLSAITAVLGLSLGLAPFVSSLRVFVVLMSLEGTAHGLLGAGQ